MCAPDLIRFPLSRFWASQPVVILPGRPTLGRSTNPFGVGSVVIVQPNHETWIKITPSYDRLSKVNCIMKAVLFPAQNRECLGSFCVVVVEYKTPPRDVGIEMATHQKTGYGIVLEASK